MLFLIYINDLCHAVGEDFSRLFADDTGLFTHGQNLNVLIQESTVIYRKLFKWCVCNRLTINYTKTCFVIFHMKNKHVPNDLKCIKIDEVTIQRVDVTKYLGLHLDEHLTWNHHVTHLYKSLIKYFGILKKLRDVITKKNC